MNEDRERYERYVQNLTGNPANPIERRVKAVGRGVVAFWMIVAFVILFLLVMFFDETVLKVKIL